MSCYEGIIESTYVHCAERKNKRIIGSMRFHLIIERRSPAPRIFPCLKTRVSALCNISRLKNTRPTDFSSELCDIISKISQAVHARPSHEDTYLKQRAPSGQSLRHGLWGNGRRRGRASSSDSRGEYTRPTTYSLGKTLTR